MTFLQKHKAALIVAAITAVAILMTLIGFRVYKMGKDAGLEESLASRPQTVETDGLVKAQKATQESLEALARANIENYSRLSKAMDAMGQHLSTVAISQGRTQVVVIRDSRSDSSSPNPNAQEVPTTPEGVPLDVHRYTQNIQHRRILSKSGLRLADVDFNAASPTPWSTKVHALRYRVTTLVSEDDEDRLSLHHSLRVDNPDFPEVETIELTEHQVQTSRGRPQWDFFDPGIMLSLGVDLRSWGPSLEFSLMSYGIPREEYYRFINIGAGVTMEERDLFFNFLPVMINTGRFLPLVDNLWVGPQLTFIPRDQSFSFGTTLSVSL